MKVGLIMSSGASNVRFLAGLAGDATAEVKDPVMLPPDMVGPKGLAWKCNLAEGRRLKGFREEDDATLVHWLIEAPWAHPAWHSYSLILVHLRPMPNQPRETYLPCASHELWLYACNPDMERTPMIMTGIPEGRWLAPVNFAAQFVEPNDADALARIDRVVEEICAGTLSPDTDFQREWVKRFGDNMIMREFP